MLRPGKFKITDEGLKLAELPKGAKVLEVGCGEGETTERLEKEYEFEVFPIDTSLEMLRITNEKGLKAKAKYGDGEFLEDFSSKTFDGIVSECVLSLIGKPDEAMHEALCTLKQGGKYIISDLYYKEENEKDLEIAKEKAHIDATTQAVHSECGEDCSDEHEFRNVDFRYEGAFFKDRMIKAMEEIGFKDFIFEDFSDELDTYVAEEIMNGNENPFGVAVKGKKGIGYFLMVATKA